MRVETVFPYTSEEFEYIRIDDGDAYSMFMTVTKIVLPMLRVLQRNKQGVPGVFAPDYGRHDVQGVFAFIDDAECESALQSGAKRWNAVIDEMIWSFEAIQDGVFDQNSAECARAQRGLDLFAKYFRNLWT